MIEQALPAIRQPTTPKWIGPLVLSGFFLLLCALVLASAAGWSAYREHVELGWPVAAAQLSDCRIHTSYDGWHGRARALHHVECSFQYRVGVVPHLVKSKVGDTLSVVDGQIDLTRPTITLSSLRRWVSDHRNGTVETIHYDPAYPDRISLVGVDRDVKWQTTAGYVRGAVTFGAAGVCLLVLGTWLRRAVSPSP